MRLGLLVVYLVLLWFVFLLCLVLRAFGPAGFYGLVVCYLLLVMVAGLWLGCCDYVWLLLWGGGGFRYLGAVLFVVIC